MKSAEQNRLGAFVRDARNQLGLSLRAVEQRTGISNAYLSQLESGKIKQPSPTILHELAEVLGVTYAEMMAHAGYPVPGKTRQTPASSGFLARFGKISTEEQDELARYLEFLRSKNRGGK